MTTMRYARARSRLHAPARRPARVAAGIGLHARPRPRRQDPSNQPSVCDAEGMTPSQRIGSFYSPTARPLTCTNLKATGGPIAIELGSEADEAEQVSTTSFLPLEIFDGGYAERLGDALWDTIGERVAAGNPIKARSRFRTEKGGGESRCARLPPSPKWGRGMRLRSAATQIALSTLPFRTGGSRARSSTTGASRAPRWSAAIDSSSSGTMLTSKSG